MCNTATSGVIGVFSSGVVVLRLVLGWRMLGAVMVSVVAALPKGAANRSGSSPAGDQVSGYTGYQGARPSAAREFALQAAHNRIVLGEGETVFAARHGEFAQQLLLPLV